MLTCIYILNVISRVCTRGMCVCVCVCVCVCDYISVADWLKILVVSLFTMVHSRHFLRTNYVGAFSPLIDWKIPVDKGVCFMCLGMRGGVSTAISSLHCEEIKTVPRHFCAC